MKLVHVLGDFCKNSCHSIGRLFQYLLAILLGTLCHRKLLSFSLMTYLSVPLVVLLILSLVDLEAIGCCNRKNAVSDQLLVIPLVVLREGSGTHLMLKYQSRLSSNASRISWASG